jgi:hypothetical protein
MRACLPSFLDLYLSSKHRFVMNAYHHTTFTANRWLQSSGDVENCPAFIQSQKSLENRSGFDHLHCCSWPLPLLCGLPCSMRNAVGKDMVAWRQPSQRSLSHRKTFTQTNVGSCLPNSTQAIRSQSRASRYIRTACTEVQKWWHTYVFSRFFL